MLPALTGCGKEHGEEGRGAGQPGHQEHAAAQQTAAHSLQQKDTEGEAHQLHHPHHGHVDVGASPQGARIQAQAVVSHAGQTPAHRKPQLQTDTGLVHVTPQLSGAAQRAVPMSSLPLPATPHASLFGKVNEIHRGLSLHQFVII